MRSVSSNIPYRAIHSREPNGEAVVKLVCMGYLEKVKDTKFLARTIFALHGHQV